MRENLKVILKDSIILEYNLPNRKKNLEACKITNLKDYCFSCIDEDKLIDLIYNAVIDYSYNSSEILNYNPDLLYKKALIKKLRFNKHHSENVKLKYGFYGEVLFHALLMTYFKTKPFISRGHFYHPLEKGEPKGYDAYHIIEENDMLELWFGEAKFHKSHSTAVTSIMSNIDKALSDDYLSDNIIAITDYENEILVPNCKLASLVNDWEVNPDICLIEEIRKRDMTFIYPIMVAYEKHKSGYEESIEKVVEYIDKFTFSASITVPYKLFFCFLPVEDVNKIKKEVLRCITDKKPLI